MKVIIYYKLIKAAGSFEMLISVYQTIQYHILEDRCLFSFHGSVCIDEWLVGVTVLCAMIYSRHCLNFAVKCVTMYDVSGFNRVVLC
jgi:hypothetical protein